MISRPPGPADDRGPARTGAPELPLALYVHIPWCVRKCPYCDFNSHAAPTELPVDDYIGALLADLDADLAEAPESRTLASIFFGGGTPSLLDGSAILRILEGVRQRLSLAPQAEITLEANPGTVEHDRFDAYLRAGVNRLSVGVQSFDDAALLRLGRIHDARTAAAAIQAARQAGFDNFNIDLMFGLPGQDLRGALEDLERALEHEPAHLSHYQLTIEANTVFAARPPTLPDHDRAWDMQLACQERLASAGLAQYEVSAYAREARRCAHNLNYWRYGDYLGIGAGAHAKRTGAQGIERRWKRKTPRSYLAATGNVARVAGRHRLEAREIPFDYALNALRLNEGFALSEFEARTGLHRTALSPALDIAVSRGWIETTPTRVTPTAHGRNFLNDVLELFLAAAPKARPARIAATLVRSPA